MGVAAGGHDFEDTVVDGEERHIEGAAAKIEHQHVLQRAYQTDMYQSASSEASHSHSASHSIITIVNMPFASVSDLTQAHASISASRRRLFAFASEQDGLWHQHALHPDTPSCHHVIMPNMPMSEHVSTKPCQRHKPT
eukprot:1013536-Rhodomonas_salina.2